MLMDLKKPAQAGDKVPLELQFEKAGKVTCRSTCRASAPRPAVPHSSGQHDMKK
jgi:copper(I)-binding protein